MKVKTVLVGARGFAYAYLEPLLENIDSEKFTFSGIVARDISKSPNYQDVIKHQIPVYKTLEAFFEAGNQADLVIIATPPHLHPEQSLLAISNGANVLCEKPIAPLYQDALRMRDVSEKTGKFIGIGFQWSFSRAIQELKKDILEGKLGKAKLVKSFVSWPRGWNYYENTWKGKIRDEDGTWILDSVAGNAAAHYLHNLYFLLGDTMDCSVFPETMRCELFRANKIENFDSCLLDIKTQSGVKLFFVASHATEIEESPKFQLVFENAVVNYNMQKNNNQIEAVFSDGQTKQYGDPSVNLDDRLWQAISSVTTGEPLACTVNTALPHTLTINYLYQFGEIVNFPKNLVVHDIDKGRTMVQGLYNLMAEAFEKEMLFSDMGISWANAKSIRIGGHIK